MLASTGRLSAGEPVRLEAKHFSPAALEAPLGRQDRPNWPRVTATAKQCQCHPLQLTNLSAVRAAQASTVGHLWS